MTYIIDRYGQSNCYSIMILVSSLNISLVENEKEV